MSELNSNKPKRRNTKEKIIDEAESLATLHGIEHLKLQDVADKIGIKLPSVYAHFSGREDILAAMATRTNKALNQMYLAKPGETAADSLRRGAQSLLSFLGEHPAYFRLLLRDYSIPPGYDSLNHRAAVNQEISLPNERQEMHQRVQSQLDRIDQLSLFSAHDYIAAVHGFVLMSLSTLPTKTDENGKAYVDYQGIAPKLDVLLNRLLS